MKRTGKRMPAFGRLQLRGAAHDLARLRSWLLLCGILLFGMALGALLCRGTAGLPQSGVALLVDEFRARRSDQSFWLTFASSFEALFVLFLILFLSGVSAAGVAAVPLVLLFRGAGIGLVMGYFYAAHAFRGFLYVLVMILPNAFLSTLAFLVLGRESMRLSLRIFRVFRPDAPGESIWPGFRLYCIRSGLILILLCVSALLDSVLAVAFGSKFVL
ncbi:MAG: stage II sporulation protein M [Acutalibacteraceae bacterium]